MKRQRFTFVDLVNEQVLMWSIKPTEGLSRGYDIAAFQKVVLFFSTSARSEVNEATQSFTGTRFETGEGHKDTMVQKLCTGYSDASKMISHLLVGIYLIALMSKWTWILVKIGEDLVCSVKEWSAFDFFLRKKVMFETIILKLSIVLDKKQFLWVFSSFLKEL